MKTIAIIALLASMAMSQPPLGQQPGNPPGVGAPAGPGGAPNPAPSPSPGQQGGNPGTGNGTPAGPAGPPVLTFDCTVMPEVCNNMCWGVHCSNGAFSKTLTSDNSAPNSVKDARRKAAGCLPSPNQCSNTGPGPNKGKGLNCDEFPFASTMEASKGGQNIRCVPSSQNSKQGGAIAAFYSKVAKTAGTKYEIAFANPTTAGVKYCTNPPGGNVCVNDGNIYNKKNLLPNPGAFTPRQKRARVTSPMYLYRTKKGVEVSSASMFEIGRKIHSFVPRNVTLGAMPMISGPTAMERSQDYDLEHVEDEIKERIV